MPLLSELAEATPGAVLNGGNIPISGVRYDSRQVQPGDLFVAIAGAKADGHHYLAQALAAGAAVLAVQADRREAWQPVAQGCPLLILPDTRVALSRLAAAFYGFPARRLRVVGITGTDGKTSLAHLTAHLLRTAGLKAGNISTTGCEIDGRAVPKFDSRFTTPEAPEVQAMLARMVSEGCTHAVVESTSHGLALHRLDDCEYDVAAVTNVGSDHLDFHGSPEEYLAAKGRLFELLDTAADKGLQKSAVLNADDASLAYLASRTQSQKLTYGIDSKADVSAGDLSVDGWKSAFHLMTPAGQANVSLAVPGRFNVYNALAAAAVAQALGLPLDAAVEAIDSWRGAPGRMELVDAGQRFRVVVDFAHAPESLERVLTFLRPLTPGRLIAVFGCIGERDRERRQPMGEISGRLADLTIVTDDNPYSEDRMAVIEDIAAGVRAAGQREGEGFRIIPDRREAIAEALALAAPGDTVLLAGKGHETTVVLPDGAYDCDDRALTLEILAKR